MLQEAAGTLVAQLRSELEALRGSTSTEIQALKEAVRGLEAERDDGLEEIQR